MPTVSSKSYKGITVHFTSPVDVFEWANGEWGIQNAPGTNSVSISNITPNPTTYGYGAGSMKNPMPEGNQGWDARPGLYDAALNLSLSFPILLSAGDSFIPSAPNAEEGYEMKTQLCIQVFAGAVAADSFRPSPYGPASSRAGTPRNYSQLNLSLLGTKATTTLTPETSYMDDRAPGLPFIEWRKEFYGYKFMGTDNMAAGAFPGHLTNYGADYSARTDREMAWLQYNLSNATKKKVLCSLIQQGLDIIEYFKHGGILYPNGGHKVGRKAGAYLAAVLFEDDDLKAEIAKPWDPVNYPNTKRFPEDECTFIIESYHVNDLSMVDAGRFISEDVGKPEWRVVGSTQPKEADFRWPAPGGVASFNGGRIPGAGGTGYRLNNWSNLLGTWAAARIMDPSAWGHIPFLLYGMRHYVVSGSPTNTFITQMIANHVVPLGDLSPNPATFKVGAVDLKNGVKLESGTPITIATTSSGASVFYIFIAAGGTDTDPTGASTPVTGAVTVTQSGTLKAVVIDEDFVIEPISSMTFTIVPSGFPCPPANQAVFST
jgi:hypothetical protein